MAKRTNNSKTVIITGGNKGIGEFITRVFHDSGYYVLIGCRTDNRLAEELGRRVRYHYADVCVESNHQALIAQAIKWTGRLDVYINCAGFSKWAALNTVDEQFWNTMMDTNIKGTFWGCKSAAGVLNKGGSIINISSLAGKRGSVNNSVYCASKFAINGITQALAKELGPRGIRVNAVCPVYVRTAGLISALQGRDSPVKGRNVNLYLREFAKDNAALGCLPSAAQIAKVCLFLASENASAVTGQCINVDCGVLPQ